MTYARGQRPGAYTRPNYVNPLGRRSHTRHDTGRDQRKQRYKFYNRNNQRLKYRRKLESNQTTWMDYMLQKAIDVLDTIQSKFTQIWVGWIS